MKNYYEITDINPKLSIRLELHGIGSPQVRAGVDQDLRLYPVHKPAIIFFKQDLFKPFDINVELFGKNYTDAFEIAVKIKSLQIDNINMIPRFNHLARYVNDKNHAEPTDYLGFNGRWTLNIDRPFYQWLHQATGQGWLLS